MQNLILLAVIVVGFFYALYRTYGKNNGGEGGCSGCSGSCSSCHLAGGCANQPDDRQ